MVIEENCHLLHCLTNFIVETSSTVPEEVSLTILNCLIPMATEMLTDNSSQSLLFQDLMLVLTTLANAGSGIGHVQLFRACAEWMRKSCRAYLGEADGRNSDHAMIENTCRILEYVSTILIIFE